MNTSSLKTRILFKEYEMKKKHKDKDACPECSGKQLVWKILYEGISKCIKKEVDSADIATALAIFTTEYVYEHAPSSEIATGILLAALTRKLDEFIENGVLTHDEVIEEFENLEDQILRERVEKDVKIH